MAETIEGINPVLEALRAERTINRILLANNIRRHSDINEIIQLAKESRVPLDYVAPQTIDRQSTTRANQGVIAFVAAKEYVELDDLLRISKEKNEAPFYVILDGIEDPQNLGSILRTADASGVHGIIIRARREVGLTAIVAKVSAGAIEYVPVARVNNIAQTVEELKKQNVWVTGIDVGSKQNYTQIDYKSATAIVIGSEGKGISPLVKSRCDNIASIPMTGKITSLNASVAASMVMYEVYRQRTEGFKASLTSPAHPEPVEG